MAEHANRTLEFWLRFVGLQLVFGPVIGIAVGWMGGWLIDRCAQACWMSEAIQGIAAIGLALLVSGITSHITGGLILYAALNLTVLRMLPAAVALIGLRLRLRLSTVLFVVWFGPRGLAPVLFALLMVERAMGKAAHQVMAIVLTTVVQRIVLHVIAARHWRLCTGGCAATHGG